MANDSIPHADARFHAWRNNFVTNVNRHLADSALAAAMSWTSTIAPRRERATTRSTPPAPANYRG